MSENMEQRRKVRQINVAREVLESFGYEVIDPDEKEEGTEAPNGQEPKYRPSMEAVADELQALIGYCNSQIGSRSGNAPFGIVQARDKIMQVRNALRVHDIIPVLPVSRGIRRDNLR